MHENVRSWLKMNIMESYYTSLSSIMLFLGRLWILKMMTIWGVVDWTLNHGSWKPVKKSSKPKSKYGNWYKLVTKKQRCEQKSKKMFRCVVIKYLFLEHLTILEIFFHVHFLLSWCKNRNNPFFLCSLKRSNNSITII